ncbi:hypothetical protein H8N03_11645 [Ramlibacter sp. USB13]|uniref:DUF2059 domain-containing protein n=1 Tax=Ramlibacter cellulosilyticus TaxID=2764187 RepID=A0A923MQZ9_9BURK|nr:hypothetical protein [Ramlibacter cellulosilyticus]MBC5783600.1 hypothetical protein [Ramlibacter cellulosilyticus]
MFQKTLLILAIAAACTTVHAQQTSTPAKKELVARILKIQQPAIDTMAQGLVQQSLGPLLEQVDNAVRRVPAEKRDAVTKGIQADIRKYVDETVPLVRDRANKVAPTTAGAILEEKFTEDELKQVITLLESPVLTKFQAAGADIQRALVQKVVAETQPQVEQRFQALEDSIAKRLGIAPPAGGNAPAASGARAPAKK